MRSNSTRWSPEQAVYAGHEAVKLLAAHGPDLKGRLPDNTSDQIGQDTAALEAAITGRPAYGAESKAATGAERSVAHRAQTLLGRLRALLRHSAAKGDPALRAAGVGMKTASSKASSVAAGLEAMINASVAHPDAFKAAGIVQSDIALCKEMHGELLAAEQSQADARITRKGLTRDKNVTQKRLEDAVIAVSLAGALVFRGDPVMAAAFQDLVPRTPARHNGAKPGPSPTPTVGESTPAVEAKPVEEIKA